MTLTQREVDRVRLRLAACHVDGKYLGQANYVARGVCTDVGRTPPSAGRIGCGELERFAAAGAECCPAARREKTIGFHASGDERSAALATSSPSHGPICMVDRATAQAERMVLPPPGPKEARWGRPSAAGRRWRVVPGRKRKGRACHSPVRYTRGGIWSGELRFRPMHAVPASPFFFVLPTWPKWAWMRTLGKGRKRSNC